MLQESTRDFQLVRDEHDISKFRILDQDTLKQVRADILGTHLPSWMQRAPKNFGSPSHGKLKADQWRTGCLVNLVITLVRRWGTPTATEREKILLNNFLDLVRAVDLATRRTMDMDRAAKFHDYMHSYLNTLTTTFQHDLVPNHHLSLHLRECLELFGPVHAWWAFPFERFNGIIQNLNTNSKTSASFAGYKHKDTDCWLDDMPLTFMRYFYIGANLRWLMATTSWPDAAPFKAMVESYNKVFRDAARSNPRLASLRPFAPEGAPDLPSFSERAAVDLPRDLYNALLARVTALVGPCFSSVFDLSDRRPGLPDSVNYLASFDHGGVKFGTKRAQLRNSFITFRMPAGDDSGILRAGQIRDVLLHPRIQDGTTILQTFFVVDEYVPLSKGHAALDPFRKYDDLETWLFYNRFGRTPQILALEDIQAHFAALTYTPIDIGEECIVVRSLDRVCRTSHIIDYRVQDLT